jgi:hypothetical protein
MNNVNPNISLDQFSETIIFESSWGTLIISFDSTTILIL